MNQNELIQLTSRLIAIQSTADNKPALHEAIDLIADMLRDNPDITIERFESEGVPSFLAYFSKTRPAKFDILLNAHVDVVPGKPEQFEAKLIDNKLYGRGSYDMKTAAVVLTDIFRRCGASSPHTVGLQIVADEENSGYNGARYQLAQGLKTDFAISGEMTDLGICNETRGLCWVDIAFKGESAHGGYPWEGENAVTRASDFAQAVLAAMPVPNQAEWRTTANIAAITTENNTHNIVPGDALLKIDFRFTPEDPIFFNKDNFYAFVTSIDPEAEILGFTTFEPPVMVEGSHPWLRSLMSAFHAVTGSEPKLIKRYGAGDGRHFAMQGQPSVEFGLSGKNLHSEDEYVDLASITPYTKTIEALLSNPIENKSLITKKRLVARKAR